MTGEDTLGGKGPGQRRRRSHTNEPFEDHAHYCRFGFVHDQLAVLDKQLPALKAALIAHQAKHVIRNSLEENRQAA
jgi:hypothetical protein